MKGLVNGTKYALKVKDLRVDDLGEYYFFAGDEVFPNPLFLREYCDGTETFVAQLDLSLMNIKSIDERQVVIGPSGAIAGFIPPHSLFMQIRAEYDYKKRIIEKAKSAEETKGELI